MRSILFRFIAAFLMVLSLGWPCLAASENEWFVSTYGGKDTENSIDDLISGDHKFEDSKFLVVALGKNLTIYKELIAIEAEGQVAKHWGYQDHFELNGDVVFRWLPFPWDDYLDTSFAVGEGLSYATQNPEIEKDKNGKTSKLLNYLAFEIAFEVPGVTGWSLFTRLHHRSGVFGLFNGVSGGSNALGVGIKYSWGGAIP